MDNAKHGTITGYYGQGCRCADCREAARLNYHAYKARHPRKPCRQDGCRKLARVGGRFCDGHIKRRRGVVAMVDLRASGDDVGYHAAHRRVRIARGPAKEHLCVSCGRRAYGWAFIHGSPGAKPAGTTASGREHGPFSLNPEHYQPMCASCHKLYDRGKLVE